MKSKYAIAFAALATISLLAVSAMADCTGRGCMGDRGQRDGFAGQCGGWMLLIDDAALEDFQNMTPAEIDTLRQEKQQELDNMTLSEIDALKQQKMQERENMTLAELKAEMSTGKGGRFMGQMGPGPRGDNFGQRGEGFASGLNGDFGMPAFLLMDDVSEEDLNNMTLSEIRDLGQQKLQELENMTLSEIRDLRQQKMQEFRNTTQCDMNCQGANCSGRAGPMTGFAGDMRTGFSGREFGQNGAGPRR
ncbi:MAG: hypothetical protein HPY61_14490 [Methanotrichaceae archaeon]|nr:hypothetical protein [Methanotrichaceae archaeon]